MAVERAKRTWHLGQLRTDRRRPVSWFNPQRHTNDSSGGVARGDHASVRSGVANLTGEQKRRRASAHAVIGHEVAKVVVIEERARGNVGGRGDLLAREDSSIQ